MATFYTYAEVLTHDHVAWVAYVQGIKKTPPGVPISEILQRTGGVYEHRLGMKEEFRDQLRNAGRLPGNKELLSVAGLATVNISLEHLRNVDPDTRIVVGYGIDYTPEESMQLGLNREQPADPAATIDAKVDPAHPWRVERD